MKLKRFNEINESKQPIQKADKQSIVDGVLDNLSKKGELSNSEKEFMIAASNDEIKDITIPKMTGNFWADMSNPHNLGTMWVGKDNVWKRLISLDEEQDENDQDDEYDNDMDSYELRRHQSMEKYFNQNPGLKEDLTDYLEKIQKLMKRGREIYKKYKKPNNDNNWNFNQALDYATSSISVDSIVNNFGYYSDDDDPIPLIGLEPRYLDYKMKKMKKK